MGSRNIIKIMKKVNERGGNQQTSSDIRSKLLISFKFTARAHMLLQPQSATIENFDCWP